MTDTSKPHFEILDGLRGIAALAVVIFHFMEWVFPDFSQNVMAHGFLAVDFFFCLSGFVIAYAYDDRIAVKGKFFFFKSRLLRLQPLVVFGSLLGLIAYLFDPFAVYTETLSAAEMAGLFICSVWLIPAPFMVDRGLNLFGFNAPSWSLFWEYVANVLYALFLYRLGRTYLWGLTVLSAGALFGVALRSGHLLGGWSGPTFWDGFARISYSFLAGMLLCRSNYLIKNKLGFIGLALLLSLAFVMPYSRWNWLTEPLVVLFYFPLLIALGAGAQVAGKLKKACAFSGKISYPLYMTHYSVLWLFGNYYTMYQPSSWTLTLLIISGVMGSVGFAFLAMKYYDTPLRKYLTYRKDKAMW